MKRGISSIIIDLTDIFGRELTEKEKIIINQANSDVVVAYIEYSGAINRELNVIRDVCREAGIIAENLEGLKSRRDQLFMEVANSPYKKAIAGGGENREEAYYCGFDFGEITKIMQDLLVDEKILSCGWVKGRPKEKEEPLFDYGPSHCTYYQCRVCGETISSKSFSVKDFFRNRRIRL